MLPLPRTLAQGRRLWHQDFEAHCSVQHLQLRTRQLKARTLNDGTVVPARTERYYVQPKAAPTTCKDLGSDLLLMAMRALERSNRERGFDFDEQTPPEVPSISVNCKMLAKRRSMSSRTMRTHIDLLMKLGVITRKEWHGTRADFELWINPKYLWNTPEIAVESDSGALSVAAILQGEATKFPLSVAFETHDNAETGIGLVDKLPPHEATDARLETLATLAGNTGPQAEPQPSLIATETASQGARRGPRASRRAAAEKARQAPKPAPGLSLQQQKQLVMAFWAYARPLLYAGVAFDEEQHRKAQNAIWYGLFGGFDGRLTAAEYGLYHQQALERVDLVADWLKRDPGRYLPMPYAEVVAGRGYFDAGNTQGFVATEAWLAKKLVNQHRYHVASVLRKAGAELRGWRLRTAGPRVLALTYSQLYHKHLKKVLALRDDRAMDLFIALMGGNPA